MNFFKWKKSMDASSVEVAEKQNIESVTVAEIHHTFFTEVDRLLVEAGIKVSVDIDDQKEFEAGKQLHNLGFTSTTLASEYSDICKEMEEAREKNFAKEQLTEAIKYFSQKYPLYRFITEDSVKMICKKYGLIYGDVQYYKGEVPQKNLKEIMYGVNAIKQEDLCYDCQRRYSGDYEYKWRHSRFISGEEFVRTRGYSSYSSSDVQTVECPLIIAAPSTDFHLNQMEIKDYELVKNSVPVPDPIVMKRVCYNGQNYFLILSAWGEEAGDPTVVNHNFN